MALKLTNPRVKICAMCQHWNGPIGGLSVKPRQNARNFFDFDPEETQTCYRTHFVKKGWHSCNDWRGRY